MTISWHGNTCFTISAPDGTLLINPPEAKSGWKAPKTKADVVVFSEEIIPKSQWKDLTSENSLVIETPGEYDSKGFFVMSITPEGKTASDSRIIVVEYDGYRFCHIANYPKELVTDSDLEKIGVVNVLAISTGGPAKKPITLGVEGALRLVNQIEPSIVIPMRYSISGKDKEFDPVDPFLREMGASDSEPQKKLALKNNQTFGEETEVVILQPQQ